MIEVPEKGMLLIGDGMYQQDIVISRFLRSGGRVNGDAPEARWNNHRGSVRKDVERVIGLLKMVRKILADDTDLPADGFVVFIFKAFVDEVRAALKE